MMVARARPGQAPPSHSVTVAVRALGLAAPRQGVRPRRPERALPLAGPYLIGTIGATSARPPELYALRSRLPLLELRREGARKKTAARVRTAMYRAKIAERCCHQGLLAEESGTSTVTLHRFFRESRVRYN